jgi:muramidase (phage lysozyme)
MHPLFQLLLFLGMGAGAYLIFTREAGASVLPPGARSLPPELVPAGRNTVTEYVPVTDEWGTPVTDEWGQPVFQGHELQVIVTLTGDTITDEEYARRLAAHGFNPDGTPMTFSDAPYAQTDIETEFAPMMSPDAAANLAAFLALIRQVESNDNYGALVGGGTFDDFSDHPAALGWPGIRRSDDGRLTTAAGAYQITRTTWSDVSQRLRLPDFTPASQDAAAVELIRRRGALPYVEAGKFDQALARLVNEWEAFKLIVAGAYPVTLAEARAIYAGAGGSLA